MRKTVHAILNAVLLTMLTLTLLFQGMVVLTSHYDRELATFVVNALQKKGYWPRQLQVRRVQFAWYGLKPAVFFNEASWSGTGYGWRLKPNFNLGIDLTNLAALGRPEWAKGALVLQNVRLAVQQDCLLSLIETHAGSAKFEAASDSVRGFRQNDSHGTQRLDTDNYVSRLVRAMLRHGMLDLKASKIIIYHGDRLVINGKIRRAQLIGRGHHKHQLRWESEFTGRLLTGILRGDWRIDGDLGGKLNSLEIHGSLNAQDYLMDVDAIQALVASLKVALPPANAAVETPAGPEASGDRSLLALPSIFLRCHFSNGKLCYRLFPRPLQPTKFAGNLTFNPYKQHWQLARLVIQDPYVSVKGHAQLQLAECWQEMKLQVVADLACQDVSKLRNYYPQGVINPEGMTWLNQAFLSGKVPSGKLFLSGKLGNFPFDGAHDELFEITLNASDVTLRYDNKWPELKEVDGRVIFLGSKLLVNTERAKILGIALDQASASIEDLARPELKVEGRVLARLEKLVRFVNRTPLKAKIGRHLARLKLTGDGRFDLRFMLPLWQDSLELKEEVLGELRISNGQVATEDLPFAVRRIEGLVRFNQDGILPSRMVGAFLNEQVLKLDVQTLGNRSDAGGDANHVDGASDVLLKAEATIQWANFAQLWPHMDWSWGAGQLPLKVEIMVPDTDDCYQLTATSNLGGLAINLPAPLNKNKRETGELMMIANRHHNTVLLSSNYCGWLLGDAQLERQKNGDWRLVGGAFRMTDRAGNDDSLARTDADNGKSVDTLSSPSVNRVTDRVVDFKVALADLEVAPWIKWLRQPANTNSLSSSLTSQQKPGSRQSTQAVPADKLPQVKSTKVGAESLAVAGSRRQLSDFLASDVMIKATAQLGNVLLDRQRLGGLTCSYGKTGSRQEIGVVSKALKGRYSWRDEATATTGAINLQLDFVDLDELTKLQTAQRKGAEKVASGSGGEDGGVAHTYDSMSWLPSKGGDIAIKKIIFGNQIITDLTAKLTPIGHNKAKFHQLGAHWHGLSIAGDGDLYLAEHGKLSAFNFIGNAQCADLGRQLKLAGITDHLAKGDSKFTFALEYRAPAMGEVSFFNVQYLTGKLQADVRNGALINLEKSMARNVTLGKMLNAFSIESLPRRVLLDFDDVTKSGLFFNSITADCRILGQRIEFDRLLLKSPAADLSAHGAVLLDRQHYDLQAKVMPHVTKSIPFAATLVGGPLAGAVGLLAERVASVAMPKLIHYDYQLVGDW